MLFWWVFAPAMSEVPSFDDTLEPRFQLSPMLLTTASVQPEQHLLLRFQCRRNRCVQRIHDGRREFEVAGQGRIEFLVERGIGGKCCGQPPLPATNQIESGVVGWKTLRRPGQSVAF